jgi:hypothetical protein
MQKCRFSPCFLMFSALFTGSIFPLVVLAVAGSSPVGHPFLQS